MLAASTTPSQQRRKFTYTNFPRGVSLHNVALIPVIVVIGTIGAFVHPAFLTTTNIFNNIIALAAPLGILVIAESIILIGGYFDLSLQSTTGLAPMLLLVCMSSGPATPGLGLPESVAWLIVLAAVVSIGLFNAFLVVKLGLNAFIVTLAGLILLQGITLGISRGRTYTNMPTFVRFLGTTKWFSIPIQTWIVVGAFLIAFVVLTYHKVGRAIYATGGDERAAKASGIRIHLLVGSLFVLGSVLSALAGVLLAAQTVAATASLGNNMIFTVFAAAVLGGISLEGGKGSIIGAGLGVLVLSMIENILTLSNVPSFWINAAYGAIIIAALTIGPLSKPLRAKFSRAAVA